MMKITFKKQPRETGLARVGNPHANVDLKVKGKLIGYIDAPTWRDAHNLWTIRFMINDPKQPMGWTWTQLKKKFDSEQSARDFIKSNEAELFAKFNFRFSH